MLPYAEISELNRLTKLAYLLGDLNARHWALGHSHRDNNQLGNFVARILQNGEAFHLAPELLTHIRVTSATTPDIVMGNADATLNLHLRTGPLSTSDHLPIVVTISTNPLLIDTAIYRDNINRADRDGMQKQLQSLHTKVQVQEATMSEAQSGHDSTANHVLKCKNPCSKRSWNPELRNRYNELWLDKKKRVQL